MEHDFPHLWEGTERLTNQGTMFLVEEDKVAEAGDIEVVHARFARSRVGAKMGTCVRGSPLTVYFGVTEMGGNPFKESNTTVENANGSPFSRINGVGQD